MGINLIDITIEKVHSLYTIDEVECEEIISLYLGRINKYDREGVRLNSYITVNENAIKEAQKLDKYFKDNRKFVGPLHGIPVAVKDQFLTKGIRTTFGSIAFKDYVPDYDAFVIKKLKEAGAIIIGKTNMPDFATGWGVSSIIGETKNPYDLDREPSGSSTGTAVAVAANLCTVGLGEDTGRSIRFPSSYCNIYGLRPTVGLASRHGMSPLVHFYDTPGPMCRNVQDLAKLLDVIAGYDPNDEATSYNLLYKGKFSEGLSKDKLKDAKIGVLRDLFGPETHDDSVKIRKVVEKAISLMEENGAVIIDPIKIPDLFNYIEKTRLYLVQSKYDIDNFLRNLPNSPVKSIEEIYEKRMYPPILDFFELIAKDGLQNPHQDPLYYQRLYLMTEFRNKILYVFARHELDAILFPTTNYLPLKWEEIRTKKYKTLERTLNTLVASQSMLPEITIPAGFTNDGLPVGIELLGKPYDEKTLLELAFSFENVAKTRKPPETCL